MLHGVDPITYGSIGDQVEFAWVNAVIQKAEDIAQERRQVFIRAITVAVQNGVARAFKT